MKTRKVDVLITDDKTDEEIFRKDGFEVPEGWSDRAATIVASKYATDSENSVLQIIDRVVDQITDWGTEQNYFPPGSKEDPQAFMGPSNFQEQLRDILINQRAAFNSPVWFNVGADTGTNQASACFVLPVEDNMESILGYAKDSGMIFKGGSGVGVNVSKLRGKGESLTNKGVASGPVSFMKVWDAVGSCVKSGGKTRRAASLVCMDADHPDIMDFIECKAHEERKAKALMAEGFGPEEAYSTVRFQNANHSIRVTNDFMKLAKKQKEIDDDPEREMLKGFGWCLIDRGDSTIAAQMNASHILRRAAEIAWKTGDPGIMFHDRTNKDNPVPLMGEIISSNPCGEYVAVDNSSCNLASLNLVKYWNGESFDWEQFGEDIHVLITAMDILVEAADYPTEEIRKTTVATRPLGLGFTNLGALLILQGLPYDSQGAREEAKRITKAMTWHAYNKSMALAKQLGSFAEFRHNKDRCADIAARLTETDETDYIWQNIQEHGLRNSQLTLLAPTGTVSLMMDCDTTGIEPLYALKTIKTLAGGGTMEIVPKCVEQALGRQATYEKHGMHSLPTIESLTPGEQAIFKTANEIHWKDHILMMAAVQPHLSGAISKTANMPADCTVEDVEEAYKMAWQEGLKSLAVYRDGCKELQPLKAVDKPEYKIDTKLPEAFSEDDTEDHWQAIRRRLPDTRRSVTHKFSIQGYEGYITVGLYENGVPGEVFIHMQKQGSTMQGIMDSFATILSVALQYGVPFDSLVDKFKDTRFEPSGWTANPDIKYATSIMDYIFRWMQLMFGDEDEDYEDIEEEVELPEKPQPKTLGIDGPPCIECNSLTTRSGSCWVCTVCGSTNGCG